MSRLAIACLTLLCFVAMPASVGFADSPIDPAITPKDTAKTAGVKISETWTDLRRAVTAAKAAKTKAAQLKSGSLIYNKLGVLKKQLSAAKSLKGMDAKGISVIINRINAFRSSNGFVSSNGFNAAKQGLLAPDGLVGDWSAFDSSMTALNPSRTY